MIEIAIDNQVIFEVMDILTNLDTLSQTNLPLSLRQERLYYNYFDSLTINATFHIYGQLNIAALEKSINEIIRRHSILRTYFSAVDGKPVQIIAPSLTIKIPIVDLRELSSDEKYFKSWDLIEKRCLHPFYLNSLPLIRTQLLHIEQDEYLFSFFVNHIIFDAFSLVIFMRELSILYNAFSNEQPSPLTELPIQYSDFISWEQQLINSEKWAKCDSFWRKKLADAQPMFKITEPPALLPCNTYHFSLSTKLVNALREMAKNENVSLFILMLTVFKALLYLYTDDNDIIVGVRNANRFPSKTQKLIGQFATQLLLRTNLWANLSFRKLLKQVRDTFSEGCKYNVSNINSGRRLIDCDPVVFNFIQIPSDVKYPSILQTKLVDFVDLKELSRYLEVRIIDDIDKVYGKAAYTNRLFDADEIEKLFESYCQLLAQVVRRPEIKISDLKL